jgi:hypothetical protein
VKLGRAVVASAVLGLATSCTVRTAAVVQLAARVD